ncbi:MAG: hypothetical protein ABIW16_06695 [Sphingomicrobium sp.]
MTADRAEWTGIGAAFAFHAALIAALSMSLAHVAQQPEPPSMEVELVDDVALQSAAPTPIASAAPPPSAPPATEQPLPLQPPPPEAVAMPTPTPAQRPIQRPQPPRPTAAAQRPTTGPARPVQRPGLGKDFLKSFDDDLAPRAGPARPAAPAYSASAKMSIGQSIIQQAKRCADRQSFIGEGANKVRLTVNLRFNPSGRLLRSPAILGSAGDPELRAKYGDLLEDQVRRIFADCSPFRLPAELYDTPAGGWKDFTFTYRVN